MERNLIIFWTVFRFWCPHPSPRASLYLLLSHQMLSVLLPSIVKAHICDLVYIVVCFPHFPQSKVKIKQRPSVKERFFQQLLQYLESRLSHRYFHFHAYTPLIKARFHLKYIFVFSRWQWSIHQCQHNFCVVLTKSLSQYFELYDMNYSSRAHII